MLRIQNNPRHEDEISSRRRSLLAGGTPLVGYAGAIAVLVLMVAFAITAPSLNVPDSRTSDTPRPIAPN